MTRIKVIGSASFGGVQYSAENLYLDDSPDLFDGRRNSSRVVAIAGDRRIPVSMRLELRSRVRYFFELLDTQWPPWRIDSICVAPGGVMIGFRDVSIPFEEAPHYYQWEATLCREAWALRKVRRLRYPPYGVDLDPSLDDDFAG